MQFARQGVRVKALCPGPVETPLLRTIFGSDPRRSPAAGPLADGTTRQAARDRRRGAFLASDESSFVNGAAFVVDGGLTAAYVTPE